MGADSSGINLRTAPPAGASRKAGMNDRKLRELSVRYALDAKEGSIPCVRNFELGAIKAELPC